MCGRSPRKAFSWLGHWMAVAGHVILWSATRRQDCSYVNFAAVDSSSSLVRLDNAYVGETGSMAGYKLELTGD